MKKQTIRLNEAQLQRAIKESVKKVLRETVDGGFGMKDRHINNTDSNADLIYTALNVVNSYIAYDDGSLERFVGRDFMQQVSQAEKTLRRFVGWLESGEEPL